jgi:hypothetical protein
MPWQGIDDGLIWGKLWVCAVLDSMIVGAQTTAASQCSSQLSQFFFAQIDRNVMARQG